MKILHCKLGRQEFLRRLKPIYVQMGKRLTLETLSALAVNIGIGEELRKEIREEIIKNKELQ